MEQKSSKNKKQEERKSGRTTRLSNIVFMGMGEPLANYRNVKKAVARIHDEVGIGHRKITISTVGIVPNIYKMAEGKDFLFYVISSIIDWMIHS